MVSRAFTKLIPYDDAVTATVIDHFTAGRIDVNEFLAYSDQFGFFTPFTLYLVGGDWVLDPNQPAAGAGSGAGCRCPGGAADQGGGGGPVGDHRGHRVR